MKKKSKDFIKEIEIDEEESQIDNMENKKQKLTELIKKSPLNLSICLMKICQENGYKPLSIDNYYQQVYTQMDDLTKTNGKKYKSKSLTVVRSALISNNLFIKDKKDKNLYSLNIKECIKYLKSIQNKSEDEKLINSDESENNNKNKNNELLGKKRKNSNDISVNKIKRYKHVYELMENMLNIFNQDEDLNKTIKIYFNKCSNYMDVIDKYKNNKEVIEGILSMFNYFKPFLKKCLNNMDTISYLNNLNSKIKGFKEELAQSQNFFK